MAALTQDIAPLKALVSESLEKQGVLSSLKAQLRAAVFSTLYYPGNHPENHPGNYKTITTTEKGRIALDLIKEFLQFYKLDQTLSVLNPECGLPDTRVDPAILSKQVGISIEEPKRPVLLSVLDPNSFHVARSQTTTSHPIIPARSAINTDSSIQPSYTNPSTVSDSSNLPLTNTPSTLASIPPHFASSSSVTQSLASKPLPSHISALAPPKPSLLPIPSLNSSLPTSSGTLNPSIPGVLADVTPPNTSSVSTTLPIPTPNSTVKPTDVLDDPFSFSTRVHARGGRVKSTPMQEPAEPQTSHITSLSLNSTISKTLASSNISETIEDDLESEKSHSDTSQSDYVTSDRSITPTHAGDKLDYIEDVSNMLIKNKLSS